MWLLTDALAELNRHFSPIDDIVAIWSITQARDAAWSHAEVLWALRDQGVIERNFVEILNRSTGMASRAFLTPCRLSRARRRSCGQRPSHICSGASTPSRSSDCASTRLVSTAMAMRTSSSPPSSAAPTTRQSR